MKRIWTPSLLALTFGLIASPGVKAEVTLLDKDEWKINFSGFVELDAFTDSTRSLTEVVGGNPVDRPDTANGMSGRTQFSMRNSRLAFGVLAPKYGGWATKGYIEMDFLGYDPAVSTTGTTNSEGAYYTNPTLRIRHAYMNAEKDGWTVLAGQTWSLIGFQPTYVLSTVSVAPVPGTLYERTPQITILKKMDITESDSIRSGFSIVRPPQRDSRVPEFDAAVQVALGGRKSSFAATNGDVKAMPTSFAISGSLRDFVIPKAGDPNGGNDTNLGSMFALNTFVPILTADQDLGNSLAFAGEFTRGKGYADEFPSWTGNLPQLSTSDTVPTTNDPNLDAGQGGFDAGGGFHIVDLRTFNLQLQYHLPHDWMTFSTIGYGQTYSDNVAGLTYVAKKVGYQRSEVYFVNLVHDVTKQMRVGLEFDHFQTNYVDNLTTNDNRIQASTWFRF